MIRNRSIINNIFCFDDMYYKVENNKCILYPDLNTQMSPEMIKKRDEILERLKQELKNYQV